MFIYLKSEHMKAHLIKKKVLSSTRLESDGVEKDMTERFCFR